VISLFCAYTGSFWDDVETVFPIRVCSLAGHSYFFFPVDVPFLKPWNQSFLTKSGSDLSRDDSASALPSPLPSLRDFFSRSVSDIVGSILLFASPGDFVLSFLNGGFGDSSGKYPLPPPAFLAASCSFLSLVNFFLFF